MWLRNISILNLLNTENILQANDFALLILICVHYCFVILRTLSPVRADAEPGKSICYDLFITFIKRHNDGLGMCEIEQNFGSKNQWVKWEDLFSFFHPDLSPTTRLEWCLARSILIVQTMWTIHIISLTSFRPYTTTTLTNKINCYYTSNLQTTLINLSPIIIVNINPNPLHIAGLEN